MATRRQKRFFMCGHRGFGTFCHRCVQDSIAQNPDDNAHTAPRPDEGRYVAGHGRPKFRRLGELGIR